MQQLLQPTATRCYIIAYYESTVELQRKTFVVIVQIQAWYLFQSYTIPILTGTYIETIINKFIF